MAGFGGAHEAPRPGRRAWDAVEPPHPGAARGADLSVYFDSSIITKWYLPEADSAAALRLRARHEPPATLTHLHRVELTTAWHLKVFRRELRIETVMQALADLEQDVDAGVWEPPSYDLADVHTRAEHLARRHAATLGIHSLDMLHVAAALALGATRFVTSDRRQASLAKAAHLDATLLSSRRRGRALTTRAGRRSRGEPRPPAPRRL
jgi:predicted nucleic acid-binding protein